MEVIKRIAPHRFPARLQAARACFQVGDIAINAAIREGCENVDVPGEKLQCGSNCGSCIPELQQLLAGAGKAG